ncbi:MAG: hypothetical protein V3T88_02390 [Nitrosomonadaceae bacterium]
MIDPKGKNKWVMPALAEAGFELHYHDGAWITDDPVGVQAFIDAYDAVPEAKAEKVDDLMNEAARRAGVIYEFIEAINGRSTPSNAKAFYNFALDLYMSVLPAARGTLEPRLQSLKGVRDTVVSSIATVNGFTLLSEVVGYDEVNDPVWP